MLVKQGCTFSSVMCIVGMPRTNEAKDDVLKQILRKEGV